MDERKINIYECSNPDCNLRFPGHDGFAKWNLCPACRSVIHVVGYFDNQNNIIPKPIVHKKWIIEVLLDNIRSAWNVGSIFRTSDGVGIKRIYVCGISPSPENPKVRKTSLDAENIIPWEQHKNGVNLVLALKSKGYLLWALEDIPFAETLFKVSMPVENSSIVLIFGNEVSGIDPGILALCDKTIAIPMVGEKSSYNVATAFGIATSFLLYRQSFSQGSTNILPNT